MRCLSPARPCHLERDKLWLAQRSRLRQPANAGRKSRLAVPLDQSILDALTDVAMPKPPAGRATRETFRAQGLTLPLHRCEALVLGSGAAGLRAAVEMKRRDVDVVVATQNIYGGTSACSGSDKQTLHTACDSGGGDDFNALAARARRRRRDGRGHRLCRGGRLAPGARLAAVHGTADPARTASAPRCATRPTTTRRAAPPVAGRAPRG